MAEISERGETKTLHLISLCSSEKNGEKKNKSIPVLDFRRDVI